MLLCLGMLVKRGEHRWKEDMPRVTLVEAGATDNAVNEVRVCGSWLYEAGKFAYLPGVVIWDYIVNVLPFLLVSLVGGRAFLAMCFMIPSIILSVSSSERVVPFEVPLLSPLSAGSFGGGPWDLMP